MDTSSESPRHVRVDPEIADLVPFFLESREAEVPKLRQALADDDLVTIEDLGHGMKGMGSAFGFDPVSRIGIELERLGGEGEGASREEIAKLIDELEAYLERVEWSVDREA
ncbi:MAG: Hpt domain-containing protein [Longimicrobiales bacterium]|nr:Hpt domain-containing protein [Longimicrobiales bacterium]